MLSTYLIIRKIHRWVIGDYFWVLLHLKTADISRPFSFIFPIYIIRITTITYHLFYISVLILIKDHQNHQINCSKTRFVFLYKTAIQICIGWCCWWLWRCLPGCWLALSSPWGLRWGKTGTYSCGSVLAFIVPLLSLAILHSQEAFTASLVADISFTAQIWHLTNIILHLGF